MMILELADVVEAKDLYQDPLPDETTNHQPIPDAIDDLDEIFNATFTESSIKNQSQRLRRLQNFYKKLNDGKQVSLVCHDMKGNYLIEDRENQLTLSTENPEHPFFLPIMSHIDIFVYFSHHWLSIPPRRWINEAHNHGKLALATILFEPNSSVTTSAFLLDIDKTCTNLVDLMEHKFLDGYLVNVEVKMDADGTGKLVHFLRCLRKMIKQKIGHDAPIIWYDAVTFSGSLDWQNSINLHNRVFYDVCDFVLVNYSWTTQDLQNTFSFESEKRNHIFFGIDFFGRNTKYERGIAGFETAMMELSLYKFSMGLFAPGLTREVLLPKEDDGLSSLYSYWVPFAKAFPPDPIPFTNPVKIGSPYSLYEKDVNGKIIHLHYEPQHRFIRIPIFGETPQVRNTQTIFPAGNYKLQHFVFEQPTKLQVKTSVVNAEITLRTMKGCVEEVTIIPEGEKATELIVGNVLLVFLRCDANEAMLNYLEIY